MNIPRDVCEADPELARRQPKAVRSTVSGATMYLENCIYEIIQKNVKRLEIGKKRHPRSYLLRITNQNNNYSLHCKHDEMKLRENRQF